MKPPSLNNVVNTTLAANTVTGAIPTNVGAAKDMQMSFICNQPFDILFSDDGTDGGEVPQVWSPVNNGVFAAGRVYTFEVGPKNSHFKAVSASPGILMYWRSSRT